MQKQVFMPLEKSLHFRILSLNEVRRATRDEKRVQAAKSEFQILCEKSISQCLNALRRVEKKVQ